MRSALIALATVLALGSITSGAQADELWALSALGVGYGTESYQFESDSSRLDGQMHGLALELSLVVGWAFVPEDLALGLGVDLTNVDSDLRGDMSVAATQLAAASLLGAWRPNKTGFSARAGVGWARGRLLGETVDSGPGGDSVDFGGLSGPVLSAGVAWTWNSLGFGARLAHARLSNDDWDVQLTTVTLSALFERP